MLGWCSDAANCASVWNRRRNPASEARASCSTFTATRRSEEHTSELQSPCNLVCRLLLEKKKQIATPSSSRLTTRPLRPRAFLYAASSLRRRRASVLVAVALFLHVADARELTDASYNIAA